MLPSLCNFQKKKTFIVIAINQLKEGSGQGKKQSYFVDWFK